jgi:hypothetical protein
MVKIYQPGNLEERERLFVLSYDTRSLKPRVLFYPLSPPLQDRADSEELQAPVFPQLVKKSTMLDIT